MSLCESDVSNLKNIKNISLLRKYVILIVYCTVYIPPDKLSEVNKMAYGIDKTDIE